MTKKKVLIVDDEKVLLISFEEELEREGYYVKTTINGYDAIEIIKKEHFDIIYTDLIMPNITGVNLCKEVKSISPNTKVVLMSGHCEELTKQKENFISVGGENRFLEKPFSSEILIEITKDLTIS